MHIQSFNLSLQMSTNTLKKVLITIYLTWTVSTISWSWSLESSSSSLQLWECFLWWRHWVLSFTRYVFTGWSTRTSSTKAMVTSLLLSPSLSSETKKSDWCSELPKMPSSACAYYKVWEGFWVPSLINFFFFLI